MCPHRSEQQSIGPNQPANTTIYYLPAQAHSTIADTSSSRALKWRRPHGYTRPLRCYQATVAERFVILIKSIITECMYVVCVQTPLLLSLSRLGASLISLRYGGASCVLITCASVIVSSSNGRARTAKIYVHTQTVTSVRFQPVRANTSPLILWPCFDIFVNRLPKCVDDNNPKKKALLENGKRLEGGFCREGCTTTYWKLVKIRQNSPHHRSDAL